MPSLREGDKAPEFRLLTDDGSEASLAGFRGRSVLLFFFPKALTPG
jgi:peroxiredoxin Q/BCP